MIGADFLCNICGQRANFNPDGDWREASSCEGCGSSVRARQIAHCLTMGLFGTSTPLASIGRSPLRGVGLSDAGPLAQMLENAFDYTNSFYHQEPRLDICAPADRWIGSVDFLTSSDVFEHVPSPVAAAFVGAYQVLRPNGLLVLTVPFDDRPETTEHFSGVIDFKIMNFDGEWLLVGKTGSGAFEVHSDLVFHGGPGTTVEMRFFSLQGIIGHLQRSGFVEIEVHSESVPSCGIFPPHNQGLPITAWKR